MMTTPLPKIYVWANEYPNDGDCVPVAVAEDGTFLASHYCTRGYERHDMGLDGSTWKHDVYAKHYPAGYELEWVDDPKSHTGLSYALRLNSAITELA